MTAFIVFISLQGSLNLMQFLLEQHADPSHVTISYAWANTVLIMFSVVTTLTFAAISTQMIIFFKTMNVQLGKMHRNQIENPWRYSMQQFKKRQVALLTLVGLALLSLITGTILTILAEKGNYCGAARAIEAIAYLAIYTLPVVFQQLMFYTVDYHKAFVLNIQTKNTDSSIEIVAKIFN